MIVPPNIQAQLDPYFPLAQPVPNMYSVAQPVPNLPLGPPVNQFMSPVRGPALQNPSMMGMAFRTPPQPQPVQPRIELSPDPNPHIYMPYIRNKNWEITIIAQCERMSTEAGYSNRQRRKLEEKLRRNALQAIGKTGGAHGPPGTNLFVGNVPVDYNCLDLAAAFTHFGALIKVKVCSYPDGEQNKSFGTFTLPSLCTSKPATSHFFIVIW